MRARYRFQIHPANLAVWLALLWTASVFGKEPVLSFNQDVRPILSENCYACHGPDKNKRKAKLRLDERDSALKVQAIVPGKPDESELVSRVFSDDAEQLMPPPDSHKTLSAEQKDLLKQWIEQGAEYQGHWAYVAPVRPALPTVKQ